MDAEKEAMMADPALMYKRAVMVLRECLSKAELIQLHEYMDGDRDDGFFWTLNQAVFEVAPELFDDPGPEVSSDPVHE